MGVLQPGEGVLTSMIEGDGRVVILLGGITSTKSPVIVHILADPEESGSFTRSFLERSSFSVVAMVFFDGLSKK